MPMLIHKRASMTFATAIVLAANSFLTVETAQAASIGVNFNAGGTPVTLNPSDSAGLPGFAQTNFNNLGNQGGTSLIDSTGTATGVSLTIPIGPGAGSLSAGAAGPNEILNNGALFNSGNNAIFLTVSNIPYSSYSLIVYDLGLTGVRQSISVGGVTYYSISPNPSSAGFIDQDAATPFVYTQAVSTNPQLPTAMSDYAIFTGLSGSSVTVIETLNSTKTSASIAMGGLQIVQTPEPASLLIVPLAALSTLRRRRATRKV